MLFAVLASAAMLTKNNALALALLPPIAIAVSRRWFIFKRWSLWSVPLLVCRDLSSLVRVLVAFVHICRRNGEVSSGPRGGTTSCCSPESPD